MAESDSESKLDEMERNNLQKIISELEAALAGSTPASRGIFQNFLQNARGRADALDKKIKDSQVERESRSRDQVVLAQMAETEKALSTGERKTFSGFLEKEFFTKKDFGELEQFYAKSWDRLTDGGKDALSHRVWEGIRREAYCFGELPKPVREKETDWAYSVLKKRDVLGGRASEIPEQDRGDFIRSYEAGKREEAQKILERDSFKKHMFRGIESKGVKQASVENSREAEGDNVERIASIPAKTEALERVKSGAKSGTDLSSFNLDGVKLSEAPDEISSAKIKAATASTAQSGSSLGRG